MKLYNTLTKSIDKFVPNDDKIVRIYTCGPTVYAKQHVGHYAAYVYWDILIRLLAAEGYAVQRVMNLTDVGHLVSDADEGEDKMEKGARAEGLTAWQVAEKWSDDFLKNFRNLNFIEPMKIAKATDYIPQNFDFIRILKEKGYTYQIDDGIYYDTSKFPRYADFAKLDLKSLKAGARVEHNPQKRNPSDFAVWKFSPKGVKRDMEWETPADLMDDNEKGRMGFPGWHLECSVIIKQELGTTIDIHTGGIDHIPVHHTNEIAQSEAANDAPLSRFWLHNHFLTADGKKMSKSLGNVYSLDDVRDKGFDEMDFKLWALQGHFMSDRDFTFEGLAAAHNRLNSWKNSAELRWQTSDVNDEGQFEIMDNLRSQATEELLDNLNTPEALKYIDEAIDAVTKDPSNINHFALTALFDFVDLYLGLDILGNTPDITDEQKELIAKRESARKNKDYKESDKIRDELLSQNIELRDSPIGPIWNRK